MNGRVYDPTIGRFIQADPIVQSPNDLQSLNRYAYVRNNPLSLIDPSGYSWLSKAWKSLKSFVKKWWRPIAAIAIVIVAPQFAPAFLGQFGAYAAAGFAAGYVSTGTLKGAFVGGLSAALFYGIGEAFAGAEMTFGNTMSKVLAHGLAGSAQSAALGGEAHAGFISAGFTQGFSAFGGFDALGVEAAGIRLWNASVAAVVGGTASALAGGKFANGGITGTFSRMFNDVAHAQNGKNRSCSGQMCRQQLYEQDSKLFQSADLSVDGQLCAGPCIGGELELSKDHGASTTIKSGFGLRASGGGGLDINIVNLGETPQNGDLSTINYLSGQLGPAGITINHYAWPEGSQWSFELNLRFPGGIGVNGGRG